MADAHLFQAWPSPRLIKGLRIHHNPVVEIVEGGRQLAVPLKIVDGSVAALGHVADGVDRLADLAQHVVATYALLAVSSIIECFFSTARAAAKSSRSTLKLTLSQYII